jgi:RNA polymerase sigma-70 factor (ECF subfamily)
MAFKTTKSMNSEDAEEFSLIKQIVAGNPSTMEIFFNRYADPLYVFICHQLDGPRADVEDIWQETLMAAINAMPTFRGKSRLFSWLCGIARHKISDHLRRQGRQPSDVFSDLPEGGLSKLLSSRSLPEEIVMLRATRTRVVEVLALLPTEYRKALVARYADEQSVSEIAQWMGKSYKATESLLSRARAAFKQTLHHLEDETE